MENGQKHWYEKWWGILLILFLTLTAIVLVALGFYIADLTGRIKGGTTANGQLLAEISDYKTAKANPVITGANNYWLGSAKPKITIVEFADFDCQNCKNSFPNIREISLNYKNDVKIIFRDFPVYENSINLALAGRCAGEQGLFWLMHDKLYARQGNFSPEELPNFANQIGADVNKFNNCLSNEKYLSDIKKDYADGQSMGITGTPTWFINGYRIEGDIPHDLFIQIIEELIK
ncbi:MAG: thioredoxin domain-containing protein [Patescibacteria group bacterium]|nr:thioredoxin domain-containing protein [Patescibacteria group bacterium]MDD5294409.1 thioredoxin domain-containing protein [Patescibacteria group bacterium]MDD5554520.1 thioredoxin domain-containing protein [Patescibacteria group bacterium]